MTRVLGVDVSKYQRRVDWKTLYDAGVRFAIVKATQGDYHKDPMLEAHAEGAAAAGMLVGLYHWCDPLEGDWAQATWFLTKAKGLPYHFACADVEQYWADWAEWPNNITQFLSPDRIEGNAHNVLEYWRKEGIKGVLYSRASFISSYAPKIASWAGNYPQWMAHYPYNSARISTTWVALQSAHAPGIAGPNMPKGCPPDSWTFWQFSGDKFSLPGVYSNPEGTKMSAVDLNFYNGDLTSLRRFCGLDAPPEPPPAELTLEQRVERLENAAEREGWKLD